MGYRRVLRVVALVFLVSNASLSALSSGYEVTNSGFSHPQLSESEMLGLSVFYQRDLLGVSLSGYIPLTDPLTDTILSSEMRLFVFDRPFTWFSLPGRYRPSVSVGVLYPLDTGSFMPSLSLDLLSVQTQNSSISVLSPHIFYVPDSSEPVGWGLSICRFGFLLW